MTRALLAAIGLLVLIVAFPERAAAQNCSATIGDVVFSGVDLLPGNFIDATATVTISCSNIPLPGVSVCPFIGFGSGGHDTTSRFATGPPGSIRYDLYQDNNHSIIWGDPALGYGSAPQVGFAGNLFGTASGTANLTLYARILANQQSLAAGTYTSVFSTSHTRFVYGVNFPLGILGCNGVLTLLNQTTRPTFTVTANVDKNCELSTENLNFGTHGALSSDVTGSGQLSVRCTNNAGYTIALGNGNTGTGPTDRRMAFDGHEIVYGLFRDAGFASPWGDGGATTVSGTGSSVQQDYDIYGRIPAQPTPPPGTYSDTIIVTVTY